MAPTKTVKSKHAPSKSDQRQTHGPKSRSSISKSKNNRASKLPPPKQQKTKSFSAAKKGKRKVYTEEELGIPKLNMITPTGIRAPSGKKKGKIFIDDPKSMMAILALVNADKEGQIESKMMKARQMEEIREARRKEAEQREQTKKNKLEETKNDIKKRGKKYKQADEVTIPKPNRQKDQKPEKRVSFAKSTTGPV